MADSDTLASLPLTSSTEGGAALYSPGGNMTRQFYVSDGTVRVLNTSFVFNPNLSFNVRGHLIRVKLSILKHV